MRDVEVSRFVRATLPEVERVLTPAGLIEYEDTFTVRDVSAADGEQYVEAEARGLRIRLRFVERENGYVYRQEGRTGPFDEMETTVTWRREDEGVRVTMRSAVALDLFPRMLTDRVAAWKREAELERALANLAADVE